MNTNKTFCLLLLAVASSGSSADEPIAPLQSSPLISSQEMKAIQNDISAFSREPIGTFSDLGFDTPLSLSAVRRLLAHGKKVIPSLRDALKSKDPKIIGFSAYSLLLLKDDGAVKQASETLESIQPKADKSEYRFAISFLRQYLRIVKREPSR